MQRFFFFAHLGGKKIEFLVFWRHDQGAKEKKLQIDENKFIMITIITYWWAIAIMTKKKSEMSQRYRDRGGLLFCVLENGGFREIVELWIWLKFRWTG